MFFQLTQVVWFLKPWKLTKSSFLLDIGEKVRIILTRKSYIIEGIHGIPFQNNIIICNLQVQCILKFCDAMLGV